MHAVTNGARPRGRRRAPCRSLPSGRAQDMPTTRHGLSGLARTSRRLGEHGVWWPPYAPSSGAEALGVGQLPD
jgi:hypothetical protein